MPEQRATITIVESLVALNLKKLCVGVSTIDELQESIDFRLGRGEDIFHTTRQFPRRAKEILLGAEKNGSLYWVINQKMAARQRILEFRQGQKSDGSQGWHIVLDSVLVPVVGGKHRPFQGWRYLEGSDAPTDAVNRNLLEDVPVEVAFAIAEFGVT